MKKAESTRTLEETHHLSQSSLLSVSTNFSDDLLSEKSSPTHLVTTQPPSVKAKYRFSGALNSLRNLRNKKSGKKGKIDLSLETPYCSNVTLESVQTGEETDELKSSKLEKHKKRSFVKKLSLMKKKKTPKSQSSGGETSSNAATPASLKRHTPEGANLSLSEVSLVNINYNEEDDDTGEYDSLLPTAAAAAANKPVILEKGDQIQIVTLTGHRTVDEQKSNQSERTSVDEPIKPERKLYKKLNITESSDDSCPLAHAPTVPYNISEVEISKLLVAAGGTVGHLTKFATNSAKGAIKKTITTTTQHKTRREYFETSSVMNKSGSLERGRRYPRPNDDSQPSIADAIIGPTGNNLKNSNLSGSISDVQVPQKESESHPLILPPAEQIERKPIIEFEVGKKVRPQYSSAVSTPSTTITTISSSSVSRINSLDAPEQFPSHDSSLDLSSKSSESSEPRSEGSSSRRRIAYIPVHANSFSEDEQVAGGSGGDKNDEYIASSQIREPLSHLSGISEYSIDTEISLTPYGDLGLDDELVRNILLEFCILEIN